MNRLADQLAGPLYLASIFFPEKAHCKQLQTQHGQGTGYFYGSHSSYETVKVYISSNISSFSLEEAYKSQLHNSIMLLAPQIVPVL